ncbi:MAG: sulfite exporter TauE/SafE family protein [Phenylobacterium sp.]
MTWLLLALAGVLAGAMNAVAGGGSFASLPALLAVGLPATLANASSTVALVPGSLASVWAYRGQGVSVGPTPLPQLLAVSVAGGLAGAILLLMTPTTLFDRVIPWLLLLATLTLAFGPRLREALARRNLRIGPAAALVAQGLLGIYAGYFGGAVGLMMMALWTLTSDLDLKTLTPARVLLVTAANATAVACFIVAGAVRWGPTLAVMAGAVVGGYLGARLGLRLPARVVRAVVLAITTLTTAAFFIRAYR